MSVFSTPLTLQSGSTITVSAWPFLTFAASFSDFRALMTTFALRAGGEGVTAPQQLLLDRVLMASVPSEADRELVAAADLPDLLDLIFALNRLEDVASKALSLHLRLLQAEKAILEAHEPLTTLPPS